MSTMPRGASIRNRALRLSNKYDWYYDEMIMPCNECGRFFLQSPKERFFSHNVPIIFTDGACQNNGNDGAKAGCGVALGQYPSDQLSFSFSGSVRRTSQRAELAGVEKGVRLGIDAVQEGDRGGDCWAEHEFVFIIIASDSEYAVSGVTEWFPEWKENGFRTSTGRRSRNESAFRKIDSIITRYEREGFGIGLWHIPREENEIADRLAKRGARKDRGE